MSQRCNIPRKACQLEGVDIIANAKVTLGPKGRNVVQENHLVHHITKMVFLLLKKLNQINSKILVLNLFVKQLQSKMILQDGTTTATVLAQSIVRNGMKAVAAGMNPMDLKCGILLLQLL